MSKLFGFDHYTVYEMDSDGMTQAMNSMLHNVNEEVQQRYLNYSHDPFTVFAKGNLSDYCKSWSGFGRTLSHYTLFKENPDVLKTAKKVFIHPNCSIPRGFIHFKKTLNPWMADAVIIPTMVRRDFAVINIKLQPLTVIFIDEENSIILVYNTLSCNTEFNDNLKDKLPQCMNKQVTVNITYDKKIHPSLSYFGPSIELLDSQQFVIPLINKEYPMNKIVQEDSLLPYNSSEDNKMTIDVYYNIMDMIKSSDQNIQIVGMKALSNMDYYTYSNTIIALLIQTKSSWWRNEKAKNNSSVRFMLRYLNFTKSGNTCFSRISHKDFELMNSLGLVYMDDGTPTLWSKIFLSRVYLDDVNFKYVPKYSD